MFYEVIAGRIFGKNGGILTYESDSSLLPGQIVQIPIGRTTAIGIVDKKVAQPNFETKKILKVLYSKPLPKHLLEAIQFMHEYYLVPYSGAVSLILPSGVDKKRRKPKTEQMFGDNAETEQSRKIAEIPLNDAQKNALKGLQEAQGATKMLFGVTGSGKTNIYLKLASNAFKKQKSSIVLVPEIALTGQLVRVFQEYFGNRVVVIHSKQTEAERHLIFNSLLNTETPKIVIGPRSALFAPLNDIGLIVIDEEHESTYYQENSPKYSALRVASFLARTIGCDCVLGSATPTLTDYFIAKNKDSLVVLTKKAKGTAVKPEIKIIDFKDRDNFSRNRYFSNALIKSISENLKNGNQTLIFHNRRGSAPLTICESCGEEIVCPNCFLPLTLHVDKFELTCHTCGFHEKVPTVCPKCKAPGLIHKGFGTKLLESELKKLFPEARIARFDADNKKDEGIEAVYDVVKEGKIDILVGTQTIAKGLDLPKLTTVGIVQADAGLSLPDFAAEERVFQLLTQVIGRVGRGHVNKAEVFVQTFRPEYPVLSFAIAENYVDFAEYLLKKRGRSGFPPYSFMAKIEITLKTESLVIKKIRELKNQLSKNNGLIVSPPMPAFHERMNRGYTWQIVVRAKSRKVLIEACKDLDPNFKVTLDPVGLL